MKRMKRILELRPDGTVYAHTKLPEWELMKKIVGGWVEQVRVLDHIEKGKFIYTYMFVNEEGLLRGLPRNEKATAIYQRNVRAQFPGHPYPFAAAEQKMSEEYKKAGFVVIENPKGHDKDDPYIVGPAIFFEGYTCDEVDRLFNGG